MEVRSADTDPEADEFQRRLLREAGPGRRARMALGLSAQVIGLARLSIRRADPGASEEEIALRFVEQHYGRDLGAAVREYLSARR